MNPAEPAYEGLIAMIEDAGKGTQEPGVLTREALERGFAEVLRQRSVCGVHHPHLVHPRARGWTLCANCFGPVWVGEL
jgi:hypothetical protein